VEVHGPYLHGNGWAAVNQFPVGAGNAPLLRREDTRIPLPLPPLAERQLVDPAEGAFVSEFGVSSSPSFESLSPTLSRAHWGVHGGGPAANCTRPDRTTAPIMRDVLIRRQSRNSEPETV